MSGDVNTTATMLVTCLPLAFFLMRSGGAFGWRLLGMGFIPLSLLAVVLTYSRFNLLVVVPMLVVLYGLALREGRSKGWLATLTACAIVAGTMFIPWDRLIERAESIEPYIAQSFASDEGNVTMSTRGYHLRIAFAIARDHPIIGVGYRNYGYYFIEEYQYQVPGADRIYGTPRSPHSSYPGIAADLGSVGLSLWVTILCLGLIGAVRAWRRFSEAADYRFTSLAESLVLMLGVHALAYGWYLPNQHMKVLWVMLGLSVAADRISKQVPRNRAAPIQLESSIRGSGLPPTLSHGSQDDATVLRAGRVSRRLQR